MPTRTHSVVVSAALLATSCSLDWGQGLADPVDVIVNTFPTEDGGIRTTVTAGFLGDSSCNRRVEGECEFIECLPDAGIRRTRSFNGVLRVGPPNPDGGSPGVVSHFVSDATETVAAEQDVPVAYQPFAPAEGVPVAAFEDSIAMPSEGAFTVPTSFSKSQDLTITLPPLGIGKHELTLFAAGQPKRITCSFSSSVGTVPSRFLREFSAGAATAATCSVNSRSIDGGVVLTGRYYPRTAPTQPVTLLP